MNYVLVLMTDLIVNHHHTYFQEHQGTTSFLYGAVAHDSETYDFAKL